MYAEKKNVPVSGSNSSVLSSLPEPQPVAQLHQDCSDLATSRLSRSLDAYAENNT